MIKPALPLSELDTLLGTAPRARWRRWLLWLAIAAGAVALTLLALRFANGGQAANYISAPVKRGNLPVSLAVTGPLKPSATSLAGAAVTGSVSEVLARPGDAVARGQLLARLDPRPLNEALAQSRQGLVETQAALAQAQAQETDLQAQVQLFSQVRRRSRGLAPSDREMLEAQAELTRAADAAIAAARAVTVAQNEIDTRTRALAASEIRSPMDGVVTQSNAAIGKSFGPQVGAALLFVIDAPYSRLNLDASADPGAASRLSENAAARVTVPDLPGEVFAGRRTGQARLRADDRRLRLRINSSGQLLRPGMIATARLDLGLHRNVQIIPDAALRFAKASDARRGAAQGSAVYVLGSDGTPRRQPVTIIASDGTRTEITPGALEPGMRVILGLR